MSATPETLFGFLQRLGITTGTVSHPPLFTVAESQALRGQIAGGHTKNLFLKDKKGRLFLVVVSEDARVDLKRLHTRIGASGRLSFGSAEEMRRHLGVEPGAVTPFGLMHDGTGAVTVVLDASMMTNERLNFHPLVNTMTTTIKRDDLVAFLAATGHAPLIVPLAEPAPTEAPEQMQST
jgi:Ala-tRNA(Pro) deacylase